jgi:hypothetical protein
LKKNDPWLPSAWELADATAIQALAQGTAEPEQQIRALRYIVEGLCRTYDLSYRPDSERNTIFAEGKRFVGLQIVTITKTNLSRMRTENG